ncbi:MAG: T9SS type A sorting domain-containing protein, partial [Bacteroidetes bacterium]|nr:T9SS type A sorting domain-containing protein [Bacteroidota bacterium]
NNSNSIFSEYCIFNGIGEFIYKSTFLSQNKIDISGLNSGIYFIKVFNQDKVSTMKFIKL